MTLGQFYNFVREDEEVCLIDDATDSIITLDDMDNWDGDTPLDQWFVVSVSAYPYFKSNESGRVLYITISED